MTKSSSVSDVQMDVSPTAKPANPPVGDVPGVELGHWLELKLGENLKTTQYFGGIDVTMPDRVTICFEKEPRVKPSRKAVTPKKEFDELNAKERHATIEKLLQGDESSIWRNILTLGSWIKQLLGGEVVPAIISCYSLDGTKVSLLRAMAIRAQSPYSDRFIMNGLDRIKNAQIEYTEAILETEVLTMRIVGTNPENEVNPKTSLQLESITATVLETQRLLQDGTDELKDQISILQSRQEEFSDVRHHQHTALLLQLHQFNLHKDGHKTIPKSFMEWYSNLWNGNENVLSFTDGSEQKLVTQFPNCMMVAQAEANTRFSVAQERRQTLNTTSGSKLHNKEVGRVRVERMADKLGMMPSPSDNSRLPLKRKRHNHDTNRTSSRDYEDRRTRPITSTGSGFAHQPVVRVGPTSAQLGYQTNSGPSRHQLVNSHDARSRKSSTLTYSTAINTVGQPSTSRETPSPSTHNRFEGHQLGYGYKSSDSDDEY